MRRLVGSSVAVAQRSCLARCEDIPRLQKHLLAQLSSSQHLITSSRAFASFDRHKSFVNNGFKVRNVSLHELVQRPWVDLQQSYGPIEMSKVRQTLPLVWKEMMSDAQGSDEVALETAEHIYEAARHCRLPKLQQSIFCYMETHYLECISLEMYGQMFTNLATAKEPQKMRAIFERAVTRYDLKQGRPPPEIIYRLGIGAAIALDDYASVKMLMREMEANDVKPSVEIVTRVMVAQAIKGDAKAVVKAAEKLNSQGERKWHEADLNRVITSLGIAGEPDAAFEFYRKSQIRLSPKTFMKLMLVCRGNARPKQALGILSSRRSFGLKILPQEYPMLLEIIEELGIAGAPGNEMALMLEEMQANDVPFTSRVHALIARNQQHLHGTPFMAMPSAEAKIEAQSRTKELDLPLLLELLDARKYAQVAAVVDTHVLPVRNDALSSGGYQETNHLSEEATIVPPWLADIAVEAYSQNQEVNKVRSLLHGFLCVRGEFKHALSRIVGVFGGKGKLRDTRIAYEAFLAMQFQGLQIFRVRDALTRFRQHQDTKAAYLLLRQVSAQIAEAMKNVKTTAGHQEDFMRVLKSSGALNFDPGRALRDVVRILLESKKLDMVVAALDQLESDGIRVRSSDYENVFGIMTKITGNDGMLYAANDFMLVWDDMTRRSVAPSKAILRLVVPVLCVKEGVNRSDSDKWKLAVLRGYHQAAENRHDTYVLPVACFSTLLEAAVETGSIEDVNAIHAGAVKTLTATMNKKHLSLADHSSILEAWNAMKLNKTARSSLTHTTC